SALVSTAGLDPVSLRPTHVRQRSPRRRQFAGRGLRRCLLWIAPCLRRNPELRDSARRTVHDAGSPRRGLSVCHTTRLAEVWSLSSSGAGGTALQASRTGVSGPPVRIRVPDRG